MHSKKAYNMPTLISNQHHWDKSYYFSLRAMECVVLCLFVSQVFQENLLFLPKSIRNYVTLPKQVNS